MLEYLALALAAIALFAAAWFLRRPPQAMALAALEQLAAQQQGLASASQAQQRDIAAVLEAARAQQGTVMGLATGLAEMKAAQEAQRKAAGESAVALTRGLDEAKQMLVKFQAESAERARAEQASHESLARLEAIIAGTKSRGTAGENLLAEVIKQLPPEFRAYDVRIGGKTVEFAIPLPDGRYLPVDSKWTSVQALAALPTASAEELPDLVASIQADVEHKVDEVAKYLDPEKTPMMAVLAVPDAVFDLCARAHATAHQRGVVIVAYSMAVPYVLSVLQVIRRFGARVDEAQLSHMVGAVVSALEEMGDELDGRFARGITSLENSRRALRGSIGKAQQAVGRVQVEASTNGHQEMLPEAA